MAGVGPLGFQATVSANRICSPLERDWIFKTRLAPVRSWRGKTHIFLRTCLFCKLDLDKSFSKMSLNEAEALRRRGQEAQRPMGPVTGPPRINRSVLPPMSRSPLPPMAGRPGPPPHLRNNGPQNNKPKLKLSQLGIQDQTPFSNFSKYVYVWTWQSVRWGCAYLLTLFSDPSGKLNFAGKAIIHADGVDFSNGSSFTIKMDDLVLQEELGKGQYGTVQKAYHRVTNVVMAMKVNRKQTLCPPLGRLTNALWGQKEIRLELDETKLHQILMELDILHKSTSDYIVEFYGAFFIESCVYYCMEYMDCGSLDKLYGDGVPEDVLAKIATSVRWEAGCYHIGGYAYSMIGA